MDLEAAIRYPTNDDDWVETVAIGGGLFFVSTAVAMVGFFVSYVLSIFTFGLGFLVGFPILLVVTWAISSVALGYVVDVMRQTIAGSDQPPRFGDWKALITDGLYALGIWLTYQLPAFLFVAIGFGAMFALAAIGVFSGNENAMAGLSMVGMMLTMATYVVAGVYLLSTTYFAPISMCAYAHEGSFRGAFSRDRLKEVATDTDYAVRWAIAAGGMIAASQFVQMLYVVLIGFGVQFYLYVVMSRLVAEGYAEVLDVENAAGESPSNYRWQDTPTEYGPVEDPGHSDGS